MKTKYFVLLPVLLLFFSCNHKPETEIPDSRTKIINASEINKKIKNGKDIAYRNATIVGDIDFTILRLYFMIVHLKVKFCRLRQIKIITPLPILIKASVL